jgi:MFS family permease
MVIWFQYIGFDAITAGLIFSIIAIGAALGNLLGGWLGDKAQKWRPKSGRILVAQISVFSGIPLTFVLFYLVPMIPESIYLYLIFGVITGLLISWCGPINNSIFSEVSEPEIRSSVYSVDRMFEGSIAALGTVFVGLAAAMFGYITPPLGVDIGSLDAATKAINKVALAQGMFFVAIIPWILCLIFYTFVYKTFPKDAENIRNILEQRRKELE